MDDVLVLEAADDLHDGVDFADVREELVAEAFALAAPFTRPAISTNSIAAGITTFVFAIRFSALQPRVRHRDDADVGLDGAEGIVRRLRLARAGDGVEEGGLADVRQSDDSGAQHRHEDIQGERPEPLD